MNGIYLYFVKKHLSSWDFNQFSNEVVRSFPNPEKVLEAKNFDSGRRFFCIDSFHRHIVAPCKPFPDKPLILRVFSRILLKTLWEKGEIACNKQFLLFPTVFSTLCQFHQI